MAVFLLPTKVLAVDSGVPQENTMKVQVKDTVTIMYDCEVKDASELDQLINFRTPYSIEVLEGKHNCTGIHYTYQPRIITMKVYPECP